MRTTNTSSTTGILVAPRLFRQEPRGVPGRLGEGLDRGEEAPEERAHQEPERYGGERDDETLHGTPPAAARGRAPVRERRIAETRPARKAPVQSVGPPQRSRTAVPAHGPIAKARLKAVM